MITYVFLGYYTSQLSSGSMECGDYGFIQSTQPLMGMCSEERLFCFVHFILSSFLVILFFFSTVSNQETMYFSTC